MAQPSFSGMSPELVEKFLLKLPIESIQHLCKVDRSVKSICSGELFWKRLVQRDFNLTELFNANSWES